MVAAGALDGDAMVSLLREVVWPEALFDPVLRLEDDGMDQIDNLFTYSFGTDEDRKLVLKSRLLLVLSAYPDLGDLFGRQGEAEKNGRMDRPAISSAPRFTMLARSASRPGPISPN